MVCLIREFDELITQSGRNPTTPKDSYGAALDGLTYGIEPAFADDAWFAQDALAETTKLVGHGPTLENVKEAVGDDATTIEVEAWLLRWEEEQGNPGLSAELLAYDDSFSPVGQPTGLILLPTANSWEALGYLYFYGADKPGDPERAIAVLRSWHQRFGANLWANYDTMLEFVVDRPPPTVEQAWELAVEQHKFAPCTTWLPGDSLRTHAR